MNAIQNKQLYYEDLKEISYMKAWNIQDEKLKSIVEIKLQNKQKKKCLVTPNYLLFVSHPNIYTMGKNGHIENLLIKEAELREIKAEFIQTNRGGDITYHGPGQIIGYPILDLENFFTDIHKYMRYLEEVIIRTVKEYGINAERSQGETGVWIDAGRPYARKICAMGVKASRWVTMHGFALNVNTNLKYFDHIVPCGIRDKSVTSLQNELETELDMEEVKNKVKHHFIEVFEVELSGL